MMHKNFFSSFSAVLLMLCIALKENEATSCNNTWSDKGVHLSGTYPSINYIWATNIGNITFRYNFQKINSCSKNNTYNNTLFSLYVTGHNRSNFANLNVSSDSCDVSTVRFRNNSFFGSAEITCSVMDEKMNFEVVVTLVQPKSDLSGRAIILQTGSEAENNSFAIRTQNITITNCPTQLNNKDLQLNQTSAKTQFRFDHLVKVSCKQHNTHLFSVKGGNFLEPILSPVFARCTYNATWHYDELKCWNGRFIRINHHSNNEHVVVFNVPTIITCKNINETNVGLIRLKVGRNMSNSSKVAWENVTLTREKNGKAVMANCTQLTKTGKNFQSRTVQLITPYSQLLENNSRIMADIGYRKIIFLNVHSNFPLSVKHLHVMKEGGRNVSIERFISKHENGIYKSVIKLDFKNVTADNMGNYTVTVTYNGKKIGIFRFELVVRDNSLTPGAKAAIALSVIISCLVLAVCLGCFIKKFVKNQSQFSDDDGEGMMILDDNDDEMNDDVFHDPFRSARLQMELTKNTDQPELENQDVPSTSKAHSSSNGVVVIENPRHQSKANNEATLDAL